MIPDWKRIKNIFKKKEEKNETIVMSRIFHIPISTSFEDFKEKFNSTILYAMNEIPDVPYLKVRADVLFYEKNYIQDRKEK